MLAAILLVVTCATASASAAEPAQQSSSQRLEDEMKSALAARDFETANRASEELIELEKSRMSPAELARFLT